MQRDAGREWSATGMGRGNGTDSECIRGIIAERTDPRAAGTGAPGDDYYRHRGAGRCLGAVMFDRPESRPITGWGGRMLWTVHRAELHAGIVIVILTCCLEPRFSAE